MIDPVGTAMNALVMRSPAAIGLVFVAGVMTSIGPCIAPRYLAIAAITNGHRRPLVPTLAFVSGLVGAFMAIGFSAGLLGSLSSFSVYVYALLAIGLVGGGIITLVRADASARGHVCADRANGRPDHSLGAIFLLGAASALVVSPCCTPIVAAIVAASTAIGKPLVGALLLLSYAAGHVLPLFLSARAGTLVERIMQSGSTAQASAIVGAVLMMALGLYYGVLA